MLRITRARLALITLAFVSLVLGAAPRPHLHGQDLPDSLDDRSFWALVTDFSEPDGYFRSDNLVSNETTFEYVIPTLEQRVAPASAYVGVGPDQNFTYIAALKPRIAFIVDIRRQNLQLHLMYKALIELSPTRAEFLARLFSRPVPDAISAKDSADTLLAAFDRVEPDDAAFEQNRTDVHNQLLRRHGFSLDDSDLAGVDYVLRSFFNAGPDIRYAVGRGSGWQPFPSYRDLMVAGDGRGVERSYIANEEIYQTLRDMEMRNLIVPVVGDFAGPRALRSVARFLQMHRATVSVFYTSNVEQYLFLYHDVWQRFYQNVASMPIDSRSTFIRSVFNTGGRGYLFRGGRPVQPPSGAIQAPGGLYGTATVPRSETLLNPISALLAAFADGRINNYNDVIELSRSGSQQ